MNPKRFFICALSLVGAPVLIGFTVLVSGLDAYAGDLLRGGARGSVAASNRGAASAESATPASSNVARANAQDALARTTRSLTDMRALQSAARSAALANGGNHLGGVVPNGLGVGGLHAIAGPANWTGANEPTQKIEGDNTAVTIKQTTQQALLNWQTFNVGKKTTLTFDQSSGGANSAQWIAFNKVTDPSGNPSQILGSIKADGQVYIINGNGVIFGGSSQVNARGLTVSSLPINTNLIGRGLLNNPDAQFLFSGLKVDGTLLDVGGAPVKNHYGDVTVQAGAVLTSPAGSGGNGGRIMLVGPNVTNDGIISTESGQTVLAAGLQVGVAAHDGSDPSLRGLDVWVGDVGNYAGTATNSGIISSLTGNTWISGRYVNQLGVIDSSTSVNLNGRIDLKASYGAVANPNFDSTTEQGAGGPMFFNQKTGVVTLGNGSATRILPDYLSTKAVPGTTLPERSQVNIEGLAIHFDQNSTVLAPSADVSVRAGVWPYKDTDGNRTIFDATGQIEPGINNYYSGPSQRFFFKDGQIYLDEAAVINTAGSVDVMVPFAQSILDVQLRGPELADSPLQRNNTLLRGKTLTVDIRKTGTFNGKYWVGTPLGDVTGLAGLIERNAAQLTAVGGNINLQAGGSIVISQKATLDVSGGFFNYEGGMVKTSLLISNGNLIAIENATPGQVYDGVFSTKSTFVSEKWGITQEFEKPLFAGILQKNYIEGAAGGSITLTAPSMAVRGQLRGLTVEGSHQRDNLPGLSSLSLNFESEKTYQIKDNDYINYIKTSPTPPAIVFSNDPIARSVPVFSLAGDSPLPLVGDWLTSITLSKDLLDEEGFGKLEVINPDGSITVPTGVALSATPKGSISLTGATIAIAGSVNAPGGDLSFTTYNISPTSAAEYDILNPSGTALFPTPNLDRGIFTLTQDAHLSAASLLVDDSLSSSMLKDPKVIDGGRITIRSYQASLDHGSEVDVSGSAYVSAAGKVSYGNGGSISILTGKDLAFPGVNRGVTDGVIGGGLVLESTLSGYSGGTGGSLSIQAGQIQIDGIHQASMVVGMAVSGTGISANTTIANITDATHYVLTAPATATGRTNLIHTQVISSTTNTGNTVTVASTKGLVVGMAVSGTGIPAYTRIASITDGTHCVLTSAATAAGTTNLTYTLALNAVTALGSNTVTVANALYLDAPFFTQGGFATYSLTGVCAPGAATPGIVESYFPIFIAAGSQINPAAESLIVTADPASNGELGLKKTLYPKGVRSPVSLSFTALGSDDPFTLDKLEVRGDIVMGAGAEIVTDAGASVSFKGGTVTLLGSVTTPGGNISITGAGSFPLTTSQKLAMIQALPTVHLGAAVQLNAAGTTQLLPDVYGRRIGKVYNGGAISISGNILAESGSLLNVDGASGILDLDPVTLINVGNPGNAGLSSTPYQLRNIATRVDSNGGTIALMGDQMLLSDAALYGAAGGATAIGGQLSVSSGNYYAEGQSRTSADVNLVVKQSGNAIVNSASALGVGMGLFDQNAVAYGNTGFFAIDRFDQGSFASLSLGGRYIADASPISFGGNVDFQGKVDIRAKGTVRLAAGGVIRANDTVQISAAYLSMGQEFRVPQHPDDTFMAFQQDKEPEEYKFAPTYGTGSLKLSANLIDVGSLSLQNIGYASLTADGGDIRGNGTLSMAGDLVLKAAQIYPTTLGKFDLFAYDHTGGKGSVTIHSSGPSVAPLSAGGSLSIYSSNIIQGGVLRAPLGTIRLGWDGFDIDPSDPDLDRPQNLIAGSTIVTSQSDHVSLLDGSVTSVSANGLKIPYGISPDGLTWIDPRGVNVTLSGLPEKAVFISADRVDMNAGSTVDISGGGDLFATRWVPGNGGSIDILGTASAAWGAGSAYQPGTLVTYGGSTWSARVRNAGQTPGSNLYWSKVAESYAVVPGFDSKFAPYGSYNTGQYASSLAGAPGYVSDSLKVGDSITLEASDGLAGGTYTLLPRGYALLEGAYLVTPVSSQAIGSFKTPDGASLVSGYTANSFNQPVEISPIRTRFEVASAAVLKERVDYAVYSANEFMGKAGSTQLTPQDAGYAAFQGNVALQLEGRLLAQSATRGAVVDISSKANIRLIGGDGGESIFDPVSLWTGVLNSWGVESLLIGGVRSKGAEGTKIDVRTNRLTLDNPKDILSAPEIILASNIELELKKGSAISSEGAMTQPADALLIKGDGTLLRVSGDSAASVIRSGLLGDTSPLMTIGANSQITGPSVILDSTYGTDLSSLAKLAKDGDKARSLTLGSGQISVVFGGAAGPSGDHSAPYSLKLAGDTLKKALESKALTLQSYQSIDFYGTGTLGGEALDKITLLGSGIRGYQQGSGNVTIQAKDVTFKNPSNAVVSNAPANQSGSLTIDAGIIHLGANKTVVAGYENLTLNASDRIVFDGTGAFSTTGNLLANTRLITGAKASSYTMSADQAVTLASSGASPVLTDDLGASLTIQGASVAANTNILLPSGQLTLRATAGPLEIGGKLSVTGTSRAFNDLTRFSGGGTITLESATGDVTLAAGSNVSVAAASTGGNAGTINVLASQGSFVNAGTLHGEAGTNGTAGSFRLDVKSLDASGLASFDAISTALDGGGFYTSRNFRIRNGDVTLDNANRSHEFTLSTDQGSILVNGSIDASGKTGGSISLAAHKNLTLVAGSNLSVAAQQFDSAGKGGSILLEAGTQLNGLANTSALLDLQQGSQINLGVDAYVAGDYTTIGSSAFEGKFTGTLHLRAPRSPEDTDVRVDSIESKILGASSVVVEGYKVYTPSDGVLNRDQRTLINNDSISFLGAAGVWNANELAMRSKLLSGADNAAALNSLLVITPGVEMLNPTGNLTLGLANNSSAGSTNAEALASADWDLSGFRYGVKSAPGVLTLRAKGDLVFNNTLSDGFTPVTRGASNGDSSMWLAPLMTIKDTLPTNAQSWSYRLTAGADLNASNFQNVLSSDALAPSKGSVIVGEFYPAVPNTTGLKSDDASKLTAAVGSTGQTADTIRIAADPTSNKGTRFEVIRTGTGDITLSAGRDVQLRNQFSTIYTAGVALPTPTTVYSSNDFVLPVLPKTEKLSPSQAGPNGTLGFVQQYYPATWSMAGGNILITAQANIGRYTQLYDNTGSPTGVIIADSSREMPTNWLYRRGYVDSATGLFASDGGFGTNTNTQNATNINDKATSTTWWIDFSNFFEGVGALGGGNVSLSAGHDVVNVDAVSPTNARMSGLQNGVNIAPDSSKLLELGGGDVSVVAGRNIDGGVYYVEKGKGDLFAGGEITTNASRSPSLGILNGSAGLDPLTWLPTTLFVGKSTFDVAARGDVLLGPISNPFLLPQGINNKFWYKTYFNTYSADAGATVTSYGGGVTHRNAVNLPGDTSARSIMATWFSNQGFFNGDSSASNASNYQPWLRLSELSLSSFSSLFSLSAPNLQSTSFGGDLNLVGSWTLFPSATGNLELAANSNIVGLQKTGVGSAGLQVWTYSSINLSDASPAALPSVTTPLAYQSVVDRSQKNAVQSNVDILQNVSLALNETGSSSGLAATSAVKQALHAPGILHAGDSNPVRLYAAGGDITGLTLFSPKATEIMAQRDITDIAFYLQNVSASDITLVSAGRDIIPFDQNSTIRSLANNRTLGNAVGDPLRSMASGDSTSAMAGDIQINGPGVMEVLSGRNIDLGTGANFSDGTGVGITSIGNIRNTNLPFGGADLIALAGVSGAGGQAGGLSLSSMNVDAFISQYLSAGTDRTQSAYLEKIGWNGEFSELTAEQKAIVALEKFYQILRDAGRNSAKAGNYDAGYEAVATLFGKDKPIGDILTRAREIRTTTGGAISLGAVGGGITMASAIFGNPLTPPGIVTEYGGAISTFTEKDVSIGQARIFTLRGGDIAMWSSNGNIAAGTSPKTVVTAPPTRVLINVNSADVQTDLGGLATGGGIGVLAAVEGVEAGNVDLIAPKGYVDAGDAGIRVTGNLNIAANIVLNSSNISSGGTSTGTNPGAVSAPSVASVSSASSSGAAAGAAMTKPDSGKPAESKPAEEPLSLYTVEVIGYGGSDAEDTEGEEKEKSP